MDFDFKIIPEIEFQNFYETFDSEKTFLQTPQYKKLRTEVGETVFLYGIFKEQKLLGIALIQKIKTRLKTFLHCPHGPLLKTNDADTLQYFLEQYKDLGKKEKCDFVRISPLFSPETKTIFEKLKYIDAPIHLVNPEKTWVLSLEDSEENLLKNMKKSTRYEVRRQEKCGISVKAENSEKSFEIFWNLHLETVKRQGFVPFPKKTTQKQLEIWKNDCLIFNGDIEQEYYSSAIIIFDNHAGYYHQGASVYCKKPVSHAVLWNAIQEAKKRGCREFNFWGVCGEDQKTHPWFGLSKFKRGFGGEEKNFLHCQDFPLTKKYWLNYAVEKYRRWKRHY